MLAPLSIESVSPNVPVPHKELAPATLMATYEFAAVGSQPALKLVWHQGDSKPPGWVPEWGGRSCLFIGEKGMLLGNGKLLPEEKFKDFKMPPETLPRSPGHWVEWVNYAKGLGPVPGSNFQYSGWTTEANHLGNVAYRTGKKIEWDYQNMRAKQRAGRSPVHQAARVSQRLGRHSEDDVAISGSANSRIGFGVRSTGTNDRDLRTVTCESRSSGESDMMMTRRDFVKQAGIASAALPAIAHAQAPQPQPVQSKEPLNPLPVRVGMTDWNLGQRGDITKIALAREIGLDGIQVSVQYPTDGKPTLRDPKTQAEFKRAALDNGIQICSLAIGNPGKQRLPMHTNPAFAILLAEAVEIAYNIGTNNILLPILGDSHIDMTSQAQVDTFVTMMKEVARYAEKYDVVVGLEDWISAADNIKLLDAIGSDHVAVYYDAHNIVSRIADSDIYAEPKMLGKRINQIHVKNAQHSARDAGRQDGLAAHGEGVLRYRIPRVVRARNRPPTKDLVADTRANIEYVKKTFRMPPQRPDRLRGASPLGLPYTLARRGPLSPAPLRVGSLARSFAAVAVRF